MACLATFCSSSYGSRTGCALWFSFFMLEPYKAVADVIAARWARHLADVLEGSPVVRPEDE